MNGDVPLGPTLTSRGDGRLDRKSSLMPTDDERACLGVRVLPVQGRPTFYNNKVAASLTLFAPESTAHRAAPATSGR